MKKENYIVFGLMIETLHSIIDLARIKYTIVCQNGFSKYRNVKRLAEAKTGFSR